jgi:hypothetical protein
MILLEGIVQQQDEYKETFICSLSKSVILPGTRRAETSRCGAESGGGLKRVPPFSCPTTKS